VANQTYAQVLVLELCYVLLNVSLYVIIKIL